MILRQKRIKPRNTVYATDASRNSPTHQLEVLKEEPSGFRLPAHHLLTDEA